jgi:hypothetical protein
VITHAVSTSSRTSEVMRTLLIVARGVDNPLPNIHCVEGILHECSLIFCLTGRSVTVCCNRAMRNDALEHMSFRILRKAWTAL